MSRSSLPVACLLAVCLLSPVTALALDNNVEISLGFGSGDLTFSGLGSADTSSLEFGVIFNHYFGGLETDESPYGAREFLQHPSLIGGGFLTYDFEAEEGPEKLEISANSFGFGGTYYTPNEEHSTGIGFIFTTQEVDIDYSFGGVTTPVSELEQTDLTLVLHQYINRSGRIELEYTIEDAETNDVSHDGYMLKLGASALIDRVWLSGYVSTGEDDWPSGYTDDDISGFGFEAGGYPTKALGLFISYDNEEIEDTETFEITDIEFAGDFYLNERAHIRGAITLHEEEEPGFIDIEETIFTLQAGFYF